MIGEAKFIFFPGLYCRKSSLKLTVFLSNLLLPIDLHGFKVYSRTHGHTHTCCVLYVLGGYDSLILCSKISVHISLCFFSFPFWLSLFTLFFVPLILWWPRLKIMEMHVWFLNLFGHSLSSGFVCNNMHFYFPW